MYQILLAATLLTTSPPFQAETRPVVVFQTEKGVIEIEVDKVRAPISAANFLKYVDGRFYDGGVINRAVRPDNTARHDVEIQVIQFQIDPSRRREQFPPVPLERTSVTGLKHLDGAVSMARSAPDTATASILDTAYDIAVRAGLHCAVLAHRTLNTLPEGTVRVSPGFFNTEKEIEFFLEAIRAISKKV